MSTTKRVLIGVSMTLVAVILYLWGHSDGRGGRAPGLLAESFAGKTKEQWAVVHRIMAQHLKNGRPTENR